MKTLQINNFTFGNKNTFLQKSKIELSENNSRMYKSLHYEALSRMHNINSITAERELKNTSNKFSFSSFKLFTKMISEKVKSKLYKLKSFDELPKSFYEPEKEINVVKKHITYTKL